MKTRLDKIVDMPEKKSVETTRHMGYNAGIEATGSMMVEVDVGKLEGLIWEFHRYLCTTKLEIAKEWVNDITIAIAEAIASGEIIKKEG